MSKSLPERRLFPHRLFLWPHPLLRRLFSNIPNRFFHKRQLLFHKRLEPLLLLSRQRQFYHDLLVELVHFLRQFHLRQLLFVRHILLARRLAKLLVASWPDPHLNRLLFFHFLPFVVGPLSKNRHCSSYFPLYNIYLCHLGHHPAFFVHFLGFLNIPYHKLFELLQLLLFVFLTLPVVFLPAHYTLSEVV